MGAAWTKLTDKFPVEMFQGRPSKDWLVWAKVEAVAAAKKSVGNATAYFSEIINLFILARQQTVISRSIFVDLIRSQSGDVYSNQGLVAISFLGSSAGNRKEVGDLSIRWRICARLRMTAARENFRASLIASNRADACLVFAIVAHLRALGTPRGLSHPKFAQFAATNDKFCRLGHLAPDCDRSILG
jgi:hypothetical protein